MATCSSEDSVLEAASLIRSNSAKLNTFVNGTATQTVQLGSGSATPTLRKMVADAQDIIALAANDAAQTALDAISANTQNKADKVAGAVSGNIAKLNSEGNLLDSGRAVEDFVLLLAYACNESLSLATMNNANIRQYKDWYENGLKRLSDAGITAKQAKHNIRTWIDSFDESVAQRRLMNRLFDGTNPDADSKPVLFVISGQSNGVGYDASCKSDRAVDCGWFWSWRDGANALKPIEDPIGELSDRGTGWCQFARRFYALTGRKVILLNIARGGASVTDDGSTSTNTWADNAYGTVRARAQAIWDAFHAAVPADSYDVGAILWVQGESEAGGIYNETVTIQDYKDGTLDVFEWTRNLVGVQDCPVFFGKIGYNITCLANAQLKACYDAVQKAEDDMCNGEDIFMGFSMAPFFADAWDEYMSDVIHYNHHGYVIYGNAFARSVVNYLNF